MMLRYCLIIFFFISQILCGQTNKDENLAIEYYKKGEFEKASKIFENVYKNKKVKAVYSKYIDCLINIQNYKKAEKIIKNFYKKQNDPTTLIDLGSLYSVQGEEILANEKFALAIKKAKENKRLIASVASKFFRTKNYEFALEAYQLAKKQSDIASYSIQIANIYSYLGEIENMYTELIELLYKHPNYFQTCKNKLRMTINDDAQNENNKKLKKLLIKSIQKNNSYEVSKMIVWLFMQEKKFQEALDYEISIDKRLLDNTMDIINLGDVSLQNQDYQTSINCFEYILKTSSKNSYYYEYCRLQLLDIKFEILQNEKITNISAMQKLKDLYKTTLDELGVKAETIDALKNFCRILSIYLNKPMDAITLLEQSINNTYLDRHDIAICKMELAKILLQQGDIWDATLLYAQVEKEFKEDVIGQKAKFEKTQISYYNGDFEWAQTQLNALKLSTSKLIANNAMKLSLLISDNLNLDTTDTALLLYANSELLFEQKKYNDCIEKLNTLKQAFPNHNLLDEVLLKKANVFIKQEKYENAIECLSEIGNKYYYDILYDDALFYMAQIYESALSDTEKAKEIYEELLLKKPNSIFINEARKRYRSLRKNKFLDLQ